MNHKFLLVSCYAKISFLQITYVSAKLYPVYPNTEGSITNASKLNTNTDERGRWKTKTAEKHATIGLEGITQFKLYKKS